MRIGILSAELGREDVHENKRLAKEILLKGHRSIVINYQKTILVFTKSRRILYQPDKKGQLHQIKVDAVIPRINESDEQSIRVATLVLEALISNGVYSTASPESIRLAKNKINSLHTLNKCKVPIPRSAAITGTRLYEVDVDKALKAVEPNSNTRLVIKLMTGTNGMGVMQANNRGEGRGIVSGFLANDIPVLLQQFIEPSKKDYYYDLRFFVIGGKFAGAMKRVSARKDEFRANITLGGIGMNYLPSESEVELAERAAKALGLSIAGVDIIPSGRSRFVIEVNTSPGFVIENVAKVNVAKKIVQQAISGAKKGKKTSPKKLTELLKTEIKVPKVRRLAEPVQSRRKYT